MAKIQFLPVCSYCHQVLWGEEISIIPEEYKDSFIMTRIGTEVYPASCPNCHHIFKSIEIPTTLPYQCENPWTLTLKEDED